MNAFREGLRDGADECFARGLVIASKWASLQLSGIVATEEEEEDGDEEEDGLEWGEQEKYSRRERDHILLAQSLISSGEFLRCAHFLRKQASVQGRGEASRSKSGALENVSTLKVKGKKGIFLAVYSLYMAGEKLKEQQLLELRGTEAKDAEKLAQDGRLAGGAGAAKPPEGTVPKVQPGNPFLGDLFNDLFPLYNRGAMDGFLLYMFAIVVRDLKKQKGGPLALRLLLSNSNDSDRNKSGMTEREEGSLPSAMTLLIESATAYPWNWSCWMDLAALCQQERVAVPQWSAFCQPEQAEAAVEDLSDRAFATWVMYQHFMAHSCLSHNDGAAASEAISNLASCRVYRKSSRGARYDSNGMDASSNTSTSVYSSGGSVEAAAAGGMEVNRALLMYQALAYYANRDYGRAQECFEQARVLDPHGLEHVDTYSNILYVKEKRAELSHLARAVTKIDKFAAETCVVTGNYYSLRGQHEKAVVNFQRALRINRHFCFLWTLMGHEFVELRNTQSAVQCYRRAVEVSPADYKAWYGLGQMYELLHLYQYALYYFKRATSIRPNDARMCSAVGSCLVKLGSKRDAMLIFERAVACGDWEGVATRELARLYREENRMAEAATCYLRKLAAAGHNLEELLQGTSAAGVAEMSSGNALSAMSAPLPVDQEQGEGVLFLATYYKEQGDFRASEVFCNFLVDVVGPEADEARAMLRDMRSQMLLSGASGDMNNTTASTASMSSGRQTRSQSRSTQQQQHQF